MVSMTDTLPPTQKLPRLRTGDPDLRPIAETDAAPLLAVVERDREHLRRYQNWPDYLHTLRDMREIIGRAQNRLRHDNGFDLVIRLDGVPVGKVGLVYIDWKRSRTEIGYWIAETAQGRGLVTRACRVLLRYAFEDRDLDEVWIRCAAANTRSRAVAERLGFTLDAPNTGQTWIHGQRVDEVLYVLSYTEWCRQQSDDTAAE